MYRVATTENGWTDENVCVRWFTSCFVPAAKAHANNNKPIVLMYDGHGSHVTLEMIDAALAHNVILFCLPPHTTHRLQPCDVGVFGLLKKAWNQCCDAVLERTGSQLKASDVVQEYMRAR
jgi:hypothetical protein